MKNFYQSVGARIARRFKNCLLPVSFLALRWMAAASGENASKNLGDLSIEQLLNEPVTSVSKKETKLQDSPAAIYVITQEDIRRSGHNSIPEMLRMVPGLDVARINANEWAISSRGFNNEFADKLLVLVDGRTVYTPAFSGVYWNAQDYVLEDIDRIEVIRGPGASVWGANAVNGVINIMTKSARETQGLAITTTAGTEDLPATSVRYGGQLATNVFYRAYVKYFNREGFITAPGHKNADDWDAIRGGMRLDWEPSPRDLLTLQGDYYNENAGQVWHKTVLTPPFAQDMNIVNRNHGGNILGRWTRSFSDTEKFTLQTYYDHFDHGDVGAGESRDTYDLDLQHQFALGERHALVAGLGYRRSTDHLSPSANTIFSPMSRSLDLYSAFVQDEITLVENRLSFTAGSKFEHNDFSGFEIQPSGRLLFKPTERQSVWGAVSRAVRTPSRFFASNSRIDEVASQPSPFGPPVLISLFGNPKVDSEKMIAYELGYRIEPSPKLSFDLAGFFNSYDDITLVVPGTPFPESTHLVVPVKQQNVGSGEVYGAELSGRWQATPDWQLVAGYTWVQMHLNSALLKPLEGDSPKNQFHLRSYWNLPHNMELNGALYYVENLPHQKVPSYVRFDLGVAWHVTKSLEVAVWGQNLFDGGHSEFTSAPYSNPFPAQIPRSVLAKVTWHF